MKSSATGSLPTCVLSDRSGLIELTRSESYALIRYRVLFKAVEARWNNCSPLRFPEKDMLSVVGRMFEPVRVIECPGVDTDDIREALKA